MFFVGCNMLACWRQHIKVWEGQVAAGGWRSAASNTSFFRRHYLNNVERIESGFYLQQ